MEGGGSSGEAIDLLVVIVDISDAFQKSSTAENPSQRVRNRAKYGWCVCVWLKGLMSMVYLLVWSRVFHKQQKYSIIG